MFFSDATIVLFSEREPTPFDKWGLRTYKHTCRKMFLRPIPGATRGLQQKHFVLRGRGLHQYETLSICNALLVSLFLHITAQKATIHEITAMVATSKMSYFQVI